MQSLVLQLQVTLKERWRRLAGIGLFFAMAALLTACAEGQPGAAVVTLPTEASTQTPEPTATALTNTTATPIPTPPSTATLESTPPPRFTAISSGSLQACALRADGTPVCWLSLGASEENTNLGIFLALPQVLLQVQISPPEGERFAAISSGAAHSCALRKDGSAVCWGEGIAYGQITAPEDERFAAISSGLRYTCALRVDGTPICWDPNGGPMQSEGKASPTATQLESEASLTAISLGVTHACALRDDGTPVCWGSDHYFFGFGEDKVIEVPPLQGERLTAISSGADFTCGLREDGTPICWDRDLDGESLPPEGERFVSISSGYDHTCALRHDGRLSVGAGILKDNRRHLRVGASWQSAVVTLIRVRLALTAPYTAGAGMHSA